MPVSLAGPSGTDNSGGTQSDVGVTAPMKPGELPSPAYIKRLWRTGIERRRLVDREAWEIIAFLGGHHYVSWDGNTHRLVTPDPRQDRQLRLKVNIMKDLWRHEIANLTSGKIIPRVLPVTAEEHDKQIALVAQRVLDHELHRTNFSLKRLELASWVTSCGLAYLHPWWNQDANDGLGDIQIDVVPHFEIAVDPACRYSVNEGQYIIHGRVLTMEESYERFGEKFTPESDSQPFAWNSLFQGGLFNTTTPNRRGVLALRMWHKPSRKYPDGFVITTINGRVVESITPYPYEHGQLPFVDFQHIRLPGRFEGQAMLSDIIPLQRDYNQSRSRMAELRRLFVGARMMAATGQLHADRMTGLPNEIVEYDPNGPYKPEMLPIPNIPQFIFQTTETTRREMLSIAGVQEVDGAASGAAHLAAQEQSHAKLSTTLQAHEKATELVGGQMLGLVKQFWDAPRLVQTWHEELDQTGVQYLKGADLSGQYAVRVVPGSSLPKSASVIANNMMQLWERKVITDPTVVLKHMDVPDADNLVDTLSIDDRQAKREHDRIYAANNPGGIVPDFWHNHEAHIKTHNNFRKTQTFEEWPEGLKAELADHVQEHYQMYQQQRQATIQLVTDEYVSAEAQQTAAYIQAQQAAGLEAVVPPEGRQYISPPKFGELQPIAPIQQTPAVPPPGGH